MYCAIWPGFDYTIEEFEREHVSCMFCLQSRWYKQAQSVSTPTFNWKYQCTEVVNWQSSGVPSLLPFWDSDLLELQNLPSYLSSNSPLFEICLQSPPSSTHLYTHTAVGLIVLHVITSQILSNSMCMFAVCVDVDVCVRDSVG